MRTRAIHDLANFPEATFFSEIAEGLELVAKNTAQIDSDARALTEAGKGRGARILAAFAEEEAAKFLILLDAVRCPRAPAARVSAHLRKCYSHLAKGIYAQACARRPWSFGNLKEWIERESQAYYLDGPNGVDWIARNEVLQSREETLYVDYCENEGVHFWNPPDILDESEVSMPFPRHAVELVSALSQSGCTQLSALQVMAQQWRPIQIADGLDSRTHRETIISFLTALDKAELLPQQEESIYSRIIANWSFPLYDLDLKEIEVDKASLVQQRENWVP